MLSKHASLIIAVSLVLMVVAACIVRTSPRRQPQPVYVEQPHEKHKPEKHKPEKHEKHKKHKD